MDVHVMQAGNHRCSLQIDDLRLGALEPAKSGRVTHGNDNAGSNGDGLRPPIGRPHMPTLQNQIR